jgi:hypothetical protein
MSCARRSGARARARPAPARSARRAPGGARASQATCRCRARWPGSRARARGRGDASAAAAGPRCGRRRDPRDGRQQPDVERALVQVGFRQRLESRSRSAARATLNASIESDLPRSRAARRAPAIASTRQRSRVTADGTVVLRDPATLRGVTVVHVLEEGRDAGHREDTLHGVASGHERELDATRESRIPAVDEELNTG